MLKKIQKTEKGYILEVKLTKLLWHEINSGSPKISYSTSDAINEFESQNINLKDYNLIEQHPRITNWDLLPDSGNWIIEKKEEECGQTKLIPKISGNSKRSLKKENES